MSKTPLHQVSHDLISSTQINDTTCQTVSTRDHPGTRNVAQCHSLSVTRLEPNGGARGNVQTFAIGFSTIEKQCRISFNEVVMRANLYSPDSVNSTV